MTLSFKHSFTTAKADGTDASLLRPSNWNAEHTVTLGHNTLIGRSTAGAGAAEEIPVTDATLALLAQANIAAILAYLGVSPATTGDGKLTLKTAADAGWLLLDDGTFGDASSGASNRANADTAALFTLIYNNVLDANAPLLTMAGGATTRAAQGSAAAAFAAHCRLSLPKQLGRAFVGAGAGSGLTARALGSTFGAETHNLNAGEIPSLTSVNAAQPISVRSTVSDVVRSASFIFGIGAGAAAWALSSSPASQQITSTDNNSISVAYTNAGQTALALTQASAAWNVMVKL
jgi:hypothetical protein